MMTFSKLGNYGNARLGNQLFQIAATIGIAVKNNHGFVFPRFAYTPYFENSLPEGSLNLPKKYLQKYLFYYDIQCLSGDWDMHGYFQSEKFFKPVEPLIRYYFKPTANTEQYLRNKYAHLWNRSTCSMHIRRTDFLTTRGFKVMPLDYYQTAMGYFDKDVLFVVFSDDIEWCKQNFIGDRFVFIENEPDIMDMFLMSFCSHHIIANSTFSWWGAWLNPNKEKKVMAPAQWFESGISRYLDQMHEDIVPEGAIRIDIDKL